MPADVIPFSDAAYQASPTKYGIEKKIFTLTADDEPDSNWAFTELESLQSFDSARTRVLGYRNAIERIAKVYPFVYNFALY